MFKTLYSVVSAAVLVLGLNGTSSAQVSNPTHVYDTIKASTITDLFAEAGVTTTVSQMEDGSMIILANVATGKVLVLGLQACGNAQGSGCKEMAMVTVNPFVGLPYSTVVENLILMNLINKDFEYGQYFFDHDDKIPMAARFEVFEYGISKGNLAWVIGSMINFSDAYFKLLMEIKMEEEAGAEQTTGFNAPSGDSAARIAGLYSSLKPDQETSRELSTVFASRSFRALLKSKNFVEDISWIVNPGESSTDLFQQRSEE